MNKRRTKTVEDPLEKLAPRFRKMVASMQTKKAQAAIDKLFGEAAPNPSNLPKKKPSKIRRGT